MQTVRQGIVDRINLRIRKQIVVAADAPIDFKLLRKSPRSVSITTCDTNYFNFSGCSDSKHKLARNLCGAKDADAKRRFGFQHDSKLPRHMEMRLDLMVADPA